MSDCNSCCSSVSTFFRSHNTSFKKKPALNWFVLLFDVLLLTYAVSAAFIKSSTMVLIGVCLFSAWNILSSVYGLSQQKRISVKQEESLSIDLQKKYQAALKVNRIMNVLNIILNLFTLASIAFNPVAGLILTAISTLIIDRVMAYCRNEMSSVENSVNDSLLENGAMLVQISN
jgi:hypothetical protein